MVAKLNKNFGMTSLLSEDFSIIPKTGMYKSAS
jgi:hypothetical protein